MCEQKWFVFVSFRPPSQGPNGQDNSQQSQQQQVTQWPQTCISHKHYYQGIMVLLRRVSLLNWNRSHDSFDYTADGWDICSKFNMDAHYKHYTWTLHLTIIRLLLNELLHSCNYGYPPIVNIHIIIDFQRTKLFTDICRVSDCETSAPDLYLSSFFVIHRWLIHQCILKINVVLYNIKHTCMLNVLCSSSCIHIQYLLLGS